MKLSGYKDAHLQILVRGYKETDKNAGNSEYLRDRAAHEASEYPESPYADNDPVEHVHSWPPMLEVGKKLTVLAHKIMRRREPGV